jgi:hypothetical protein
MTLDDLMNELRSSGAGGDYTVLALGTMQERHAAAQLVCGSVRVIHSTRKIVIEAPAPERLEVL